MSRKCRVHTSSKSGEGVFLTRTKSPVLMLMLSSLKEEKWTLSSRPLLGSTGSLVHWNTGLCLTACLKYLLRVIMSSDVKSEI